MSSGNQKMNPSGGCPPAPCCPPIIIKTKTQQQRGQTVVFQLPPVNIVCEIPPPPKNQNPPKVCYIPIVCCEEGDNVGPAAAPENCQQTKRNDCPWYP